MKNKNVIIHIMLFVVFLLLIILPAPNLLHYDYEITYEILRGMVYIIIGCIGLLFQYHYLMKKYLTIFNLSIHWMYILNGILFVVFISFFIHFMNYIHFIKTDCVTIDGCEPPGKSYYEFMLSLFGITGIIAQFLHFKRYLSELYDKE